MITRLSIPPLLLASSLLSSSLLPAQGRQVTPDPACESWEGQGDTQYFGRFASGRIQLATAGLRGRVQTVRGLAFRPDFRNHTARTGGGRTWRATTIHMAHCDNSTLTTSLNSNVGTSATRVFSGAMSWPDVQGAPKTQPMPWMPAIPLDVQYPYDGQRDLLADIAFSSGTMHNGGSFADYHLDRSTFSYNAGGSYGTLGGYRDQGGCIDSLATRKYGADTWGRVSIYGPKYATTVRQNTMEHAFGGSFFPPSTPVVLAMSPIVHVQGIPMPGTPCNRIHLDPAAMVLFPEVTKTNGSFSSQLGGSGYVVPLVTGLAGTQLVAQSAWTDTGNGRFMLSGAAWTSIPHLPQDPSESGEHLAFVGGSATSSIGGQTHPPLVRWSL